MSTKPTQIDFIQSHQPPLESGEYQIKISQTLKRNTVTLLNPRVTKNFYVAGERFHILPEHIKSAFPPPHSLGEHSNVFPHLMLSRNTLPWEREAVPGDTNTPWLALLVVHESEQADATVATTTVGELKTGSTASPWFPEIDELEPGQTDTTKVEVLDIKKSLLVDILPNQTALNFLAHIRQGKDDAGNVVGEDVAVLVANRLPQKGAVNTVHLVALENRYHANGTFNDQGAGDNDLIRLVTLHSWAFTSTEHFKVSGTFLEKASDLPPTIKNKLLMLKDREFFTEGDFSGALTNEAGFTVQELTGHQEAIYEDFAYGDFAKILTHLDRKTATLRLPDVGNTTTNAGINGFLQTGFYPLPHKLRGGAQTVSWYHGPLAPKSNAETFPFPAKGSDALLRYYGGNSMFDVSYAAAWELGRLLALQNTHFSTELYQWKRRYAKCKCCEMQCAMDNIGHLQGGHRDYTPEPLPQSVTDWLTGLKNLKGVPFNYLVPDERLLPAESIRFFQLDRLWIESLLDGAFSIGRVTSSDHALDAEIAADEVDLTATPVSGFILRSEAVSGWPGMQIEGYNTMPTTEDDAGKINLIRREYLSKNVLLCLFEGDLQTLDLHLKPEVLHFGLTPKDDGSGGYKKVLRDSTGVENATHTVDVPLDTQQVLDVDELLGHIRVYKDDIAWPSTEPEESSANLALQLLEGVERVRFSTGNHIP